MIFRKPFKTPSTHIIYPQHILSLKVAFYLPYLVHGLYASAQMPQSHRDLPKHYALVLHLKLPADHSALFLRTLVCFHTWLSVCPEDKSGESVKQVTTNVSKKQTKQNKKKPLLKYFGYTFISVL